jgi:hypothetical protein
MSACRFAARPASFLGIPIIVLGASRNRSSCFGLMALTLKPHNQKRLDNGTSIATWIMLGAPPLVAISQSAISAKPLDRLRATALASSGRGGRIAPLGTN